TLSRRGETAPEVRRTMLVQERQNMTSNENPNKDVSFAETALRLGGETEEEARRTGAVDRADDEVEAMFAPQYKTSNSPVHRAVWDEHVPINLFVPAKVSAEQLSEPVLKRSLEVMRKHRREGTLYGADGKVPENVLADLADAGYWGLLIEKKYGGQGLSIQHF